MKTLFTREAVITKALDGISFDIQEGELVGYLGPNGAGKSTTIKILTGILVPTCGDVQVVGMLPYKRRTELAKRIGVVFGQRSQLWWHIPLIESFQLLKAIYKIPENIYQDNLDLLVAYRPSSNFSLFGTVYPDYSHVESEIQGIVLSDIEKRLTDRRPFFQEDGRMFYSPIQLFYSRRIGEMDYGAKAMGKVRRLNLALMDVQAKSPANNNLVLRARGDVGKASTLGLLYVGKEKPEAYNRALSLDGRFSLPFAARWSIAYAKSWSPNVDGAGESAFFSDIGRKGLPLSCSVTYRDVDANFTAENGYIPLKDIRQASYWVLYSWRPVGTPLHSLNLQSVGHRFWNHAGEVTRSELFEMVGLDFRGKLHTGIFRRDWTHDGYDNGLTAVQFLYNRQKPDHLFVIYSFGEFDGSRANFTTFALNLIPWKTLAMGLKGEYLRRRFPDGHKTHEISTRTSINYELGQDRWITLRIRLGTDNERNFNGVLKYTFTSRWVGYIVYGDQEAKQTVHRLFVKISATL